MSEVRAGKVEKAAILDGEPRFSYAWFFDDGDAEAAQITELCNRIYRFGRGLDSAYAAGSVISASILEQRIAAHKGSVAHPSSGSGGAPGKTILPCPGLGSLESLRKRFAATTHRFSKAQRSKGRNFRQPPKSLSHLVAYDRPPRRLLFELRELGTRGAFYPIRLEHATTITKAVRDLAFERLSSAIESREVIERLILGREATDADKPRRVRFIPLPSIGSSFTDPSIRRMLVEMPADCPIDEADMRWALAGQRVPAIGSIDEETGEVRGLRLFEAASEEMLWYYGARGGSAVHWQTVTAAILSARHPRGKMSGADRAEFERHLTFAVVAALRHAGVQAPPRMVTIHREPFFARGARADMFEPDRFNRRQMFHVDILLERAVTGPLTIGDGRWLGLGLMRPVRDGRHTSEPLGESIEAPELEDDQDDETGDGA
jgi:CRISPR-associated protein Csb2